jgi:hypothetical protein
MKRATAERVSLVIRAIPYPCWKCSHEDVAVAAIHLDGITDVYQVITTESGLALDYAAELLTVAGHPQMTTIKGRKSRTAKETYLSNGCSWCDALFGQFPLSEKLIGVLAAGEVSTLPVLATVERSAIEWYAIIGLSATSGNLD